jgi:hypothetical protein
VLLISWSQVRILPGALCPESRGASHLLVAGSNPAGGTLSGISRCFSSLGRRFESCRGHSVRNLAVLLISWSQVRILPGALCPESRGASHLLVAGSNPAGGTLSGISRCFSSLGRRFESCRGHSVRNLAVLLISWSQVRILPGALCPESRGASHLLVAGSNPAGGTLSGISRCFSSLGRRFESCRGHSLSNLARFAWSIQPTRAPWCDDTIASHPPSRTPSGRTGPGIGVGLPASTARRIECGDSGDPARRPDPR